MIDGFKFGGWFVNDVNGDYGAYTGYYVTVGHSQDGWFALEIRRGVIVGIAVAIYKVQHKLLILQEEHFPLVVSLLLTTEEYCF